MTKHMTTVIILAALTGLFHTGCDSDHPSTTTQITKFDDAQGDCTNGGVKIEVLILNLFFYIAAIGFANTPRSAGPHFTQIRL